MKKISRINEGWGSMIRRDITSDMREEDGFLVTTSYGVKMVLKDKDVRYEEKLEDMLTVNNSSSTHIYHFGRPDEDDYSYVVKDDRDHGKGVIMVSYPEWDEKYDTDICREDYISLCKCAAKILSGVADHLEDVPSRAGSEYSGNYALLLATESTVYRWFIEQDDLWDNWLDLWEDDFKTTFSYWDGFITWTYDNRANYIAIPITPDTVKNFKKYLEFTEESFKTE